LLNTKYTTKIAKYTTQILKRRKIEYSTNC